MSLYPVPLEEILKNIEKLNPGVSLKADEYIFGQSTEIPVEASGVNTSMKITSAGTDSPYAGEVTIKHIRLALPDLVVLIPDEIGVSNLTNTMDLANWLNKLYGTAFTIDDIVNTPINLVDNRGSVTLTATGTSRAWYGSVVFNVVPGRFELETTVTTTKLNGLDYPDPLVGRPFGNAYSYWRNFSAQHLPLEAITAGPGADLNTVREALVAITGDAWVVDTSARYSLKGAEVLYVGTTAGYPESSERYEKVVVVKLGTDCLGLSGRMFLQYNLPFA